MRGHCLCAQLRLQGKFIFIIRPSLQVIKPLDEHFNVLSADTIYIAWGGQCELNPELHNIMKEIAIKELKADT